MFLLNRYVYYTVLFTPWLCFVILNSAGLVNSTQFVMGLLGWAFYGTIIMFERRKQVYRHKINVLTIQFEKSLADARLEMQELALRSIASEMHDNIKMSMVMAKTNLTASHGTTNMEEKQQLIHSSVEMIDNAYKSLDNLACVFNPEIIMKEGLIDALKMEIANLRKTNQFEIDFRVTGLGCLDEEARELLTFRIIQESLQNILKHARATAIKVLLHYNKDSLELIVKDNGIGIDTSQLHKIGKAGLGNIKNRVKVLEGKLSITSAPGEGTTILASIPYRGLKKKKKKGYRWYHQVVDFFRDKLA